jgi:hypothetical protein
MKNLIQTLPKPKITNGGRWSYNETVFYQIHFLIDSSHGFSNDSHHAKPTSISDEEGKQSPNEITVHPNILLHLGHASRNHYAEINNLDAIGTTEKLSGFNKPRPVSAKRPPSSITRKNVSFTKK